MKVLVTGSSGLVGSEAVEHFDRQGHEVLGLRRTTDAQAELKAAGIQPLTADVTRPEDLAKLPRPFDWVVNAVSSTKGGVDEYPTRYAGNL